MAALLKEHATTKLGERERDIFRVSCSPGEGGGEALPKRVEHF